MKSLLGLSCNKSYGTGNTNKLIVSNPSDIKRHFAFLHSFQFCQIFLLNTDLLFAKQGLLIADNILNVHRVIDTMYLNVTSFSR